MKKGEKKEKLVILEKYPLQWPADWPRTLLSDREAKHSWKKTWREAMTSLADELDRFGVMSATVTRKDPADITRADDPSVAVYFSRKREEDYSWQKALQIDNPAPSLEEINAAFRNLSKQHHPDSVERGSGGNVEIFHALSKHKENAVAYINRRSGAANDLVIACDKYELYQWNLNAVVNSIRSLRQLERDGASSVLQRTMVGLAALKAGKEQNDVVPASA